MAVVCKHDIKEEWNFRINISSRRITSGKNRTSDRAGSKFQKPTQYLDDKVGLKNVKENVRKKYEKKKCKLRNSEKFTLIIFELRFYEFSNKSQCML
jgi:hypothetical protein